VKESFPPFSFDWEKVPPKHASGGFRLVGGNVTIMLGYAVYDEGVLLHAITKIGDQNPDLWRRYWTSHDVAVASAEELVEDAEYYLFNVLGLRPRPVEDLDLDDFIEHLQARLDGGLH